MNGNSKVTFFSMLFQLTFGYHQKSTNNCTDVHFNQYFSSTPPLSLV